MKMGMPVLLPSVLCKILKESGVCRCELYTRGEPQGNRWGIVHGERV